MCCQLHHLAVAVRMRIELIATDRQSVMLTVTPTNPVICTVPIAIGRTRITRMKILRPHQLDEQIINVDSKGIEPFQQYCNCSSPSVGHDNPSCIGDRIRTCNLPAPGGRSGQSEYSYNLAALLLPFSYLGLMVILS